MRRGFFHAATAAAVVFGSGAIGGAEVAIVSHVKVLTEHVPDVSSLDAWKSSFIRPGMTDEQKALAIWQSVVQFQHQDAPPAEFLQSGDLVADPIKLFNVYGYSFCSVASANVQALARYAGLQARGWTIRAHVVPEVYWDGRWHMLDASLINYFGSSDGPIAEVADVVAAVKTWLNAHSGLKGNNDALLAFQREGGWTGWKRGPQLLADCPFYGGDGWLPAGTHGWYSTMQEYDGSTLFAYESGYSQGYQVNVQLRPGERLTRNWSNRGLFVNDDGRERPASLTGKMGQEAFRYTPKYGDLAPGRIGNGVVEYDAPLADPRFRAGALRVENLDFRSGVDGPTMTVKDPAKLGVLELRMPSSYVYLTGTVQLEATVPAGKIVVEYSDNHGLDWRLFADITKSGAQRIDLGPFVRRRYDYRLRFQLEGSGTGLASLRLRHDVQHSQRPLPALAKGTNKIRFSARAPEGTLTIEGSLHPENRSKQLIYRDFHPTVAGLADPWLRVEDREGSITFPISTPGDLVRLRFGCFYRARSAQDRWDLLVSFDDGKSFTKAAVAQGPAVAGGRFVTFDDVPPGVKKALVRFAGFQRNTTCMFNLRIDADYHEPKGGFAPVRVTYVWDEGGVEKSDVHVAQTPAETYEIHCAKEPTMKRISLEIAE